MGTAAPGHQSRVPLHKLAAATDLEHAVRVFSLRLRRNLVRKTPALNDLSVFNSVQIDVDARFALDRSFGGSENEVSLSENKLDLIDAPAFDEPFQVLSKRWTALLLTRCRDPGLRRGTMPASPALP